MTASADDHVRSLGETLAKAASEYGIAAAGLGQAKARWEKAKESLSEADGNLQNYMEEIASNGVTEAQEE